MMGVAATALAAPTLGRGVGWADGPHGSYPGLCTECHRFSVWPAPAITEGDSATHDSRGANCSACHTVRPAPVADLTAPTALVSAVTGSEISVAWTPVTGALTYRVFRATAAAGPYTAVGTTAGLSRNDTGLSAGKRYFYQVKGIDAGGLLGPASATVSAVTYGAPSVKVDSSLSQLSATGWITRTGSSYYGGSTRSASTAGRRITVPFRGTKVTWYGTRGKAFGKAKVYVDGVYQRTVDLYYRSTLYNRALYTKTGLSDGAHTLVVIVSSSKNSRATGRRVDVDALGFTGIAPGLNQEENSATTAGTWNALSGSSFSAGAATSSQESTASITYGFRGTGVTWLGSKTPANGTASVYVDGVLKGTVDLWAARAVYRRPLFSIAGLSKTTHTLKIVPSAAHNAVGTGNVIDVDAFVTR
jgi:hypothetical protein